MKLHAIALAASALSAVAAAQGLEVIYCEIPTQAKSIVPGALDEITSLPEATNFRSIEDIIVSPDGSRWLVRARTQQGSNEELILLMGSGTTGTMFAQEGQPVPGGVAGEVCDFFGSGLGRFNSANEFAYSLRARGGLASTFQKVVVWDGVTSTIPTQMGDLYTGLLDDSPAISGDEIVGNSIGSIHLLDDGRVGAQDSTIGNINSSNRPAIFYDRAAFLQTEVSNVTKLGGVGTIQPDSISANTFYSSLDGLHWIAEIDVDPAIASVSALVYDNQIQIEVNQLIPTTSITCGSIFAQGITASGTWFARGRDNSSTGSGAPDWAVINGALIAKTGDAIGSELLGDTFFGLTTNDVGDWVLCANTNNANPAANEVVIWNGTVVVREGDPVDVDGNGLFDDNAFIGRGNPALAAFQANDFQLTNSNTLYFIASLNDGAGSDLHSSPVFGTPDALIRIALVPPCGQVAAYCTAGTTTNGCVPSISGSGSPSASSGSGFTIDIVGIEGQKQGLIFYGVNGGHAAPWGVGGTSFLCVKSPTQRMAGGTSGGTVNGCDGALSVDWNAFIATHPSAQGQPFAGGETVWAQGWFRDPPAVKTTNLSDGLRFDVCP